MTASAGSRNLKVLFLAQRFPYPMDTGGKIRTGKLLEQLRQVFDVTLVSNVESPKDDGYVKDVGKLSSEFLPVPWKETRKYSIAFYVKVLMRLLSRFPVSVVNDYSPQVEWTLLEALRKNQYDLLVCDFLQPSINCRRVTGCQTLLFQHNVEAVIPRRHYDTTANPLVRLFWWLQWRKMARYEKEACNRFHGIVTVSDHDKQLIEEAYGAKAVFAIPTGVDTDYFEPRDDDIDGESLVFTGSMDWLPNEDAILFFAREILWRIKERVPGVRLSVVGRNPSRHLLSQLAQHPEVQVVGWVPDVRPHISRHAVYVIPLRIGGGTRIKAYEAMAMGKAVVSTRIGIEGLPVTDGVQVLLADEPDSFADSVVRLLHERALRERLGRTARDFVERECGWQNAGQVFADICRKVASL